MKQFLYQARVIVSTAWQRNLTYRSTVIAYRVGETLEILVLILMWSAIYADSSGPIKGFTEQEMITYVLIGNLVTSLTRNFLSGFVSYQINQGRLSMYLIRPISFIQFVFLHELGRAFLTTVLSFGTQLLVTALFFNVLVVNTDLSYLFLILPMIFFAIIVEMLIGFLVGTIAFWTDEVDGIHRTVDRIRRFFAGGYFPLTLFPHVLILASTYMPFQYSFYAPAALYLGKMSFEEGVYGIIVQIVWIVLLAGVVRIVWRRGLLRYEAVGS